MPFLLGEHDGSAPIHVATTHPHLLAGLNIGWVTGDGVAAYLSDGTLWPTAPPMG